MANRLISYGTTGIAALALWIVPSVGTRGQGTLGDRFAHADRAVMAPNDRSGAEVDVEPDAATKAALARADSLVVRAVSGL